MQTKHVLLAVLLLVCGPAFANPLPSETQAIAARSTRNQLRGLSVGKFQSAFFWRDRSLKKPGVAAAVRLLARHAAAESKLQGSLQAVSLQDGQVGVVVTNRGALKYGSFLRPIQDPDVVGIDGQTVVKALLEKARVLRSGTKVETVKVETGW